MSEEFNDVLTKTLDKALVTLPFRQREVIKLRLGLNGSQRYTLKQIGEIFKLSRERIRQIEDQAYSKIRSYFLCKIPEELIPKNWREYGKRYQKIRKVLNNKAEKYKEAISMLVKIADVKVSEPLGENYEEIKGLIESIRHHGLLQPILIDKEMNLIAGKKRLRAHIALGRDTIEANFLDETDEFTKKEISIEENIRRKDYSWPEEVRAIAELLRIKQEKYGRAIKGHGSKGRWGIKQMAEFLGMSTGSVSQDINLAKALEEFPELANEENKASAWEKYQRMKRSPMKIPKETSLTVKIVAQILADLKSTGKISFSSQELYIVYSWQGINYKKEDIEKALEFLSTPPFSIFQKRDGEYSLTNNSIGPVIEKIDLLLQAFNRMKTQRKR